MLALDGIHVLDLSRLAPGPYCTMLLGDLGADVLLVEEAGPGAARRLRTSRLPADKAGRERAIAFDPLARNKRSIALNLKDEPAREVFYRLARGADVVVEGFRPGVVRRLGVDYEQISAINPRIVYCSLSGYGQTGPYAQLVGHDINYISVGGALGLTGRPGQTPAIPMNLLADFAAGGQQAALAIVVALLARTRSGQGQYLDVAMSDGVLAMLASVASQYFMAGVVPRPGEYLLNGGAPPYNVYQTADGGWISIGSLEPWFWANLCRALGHQEFIADEFNQDRYPEISRVFREVFRTRTRDHWFKVLSESDIGAAPVYRIDEALEDRHNLQRGMVVELNHPDHGVIKQVGVATKYSATPGSVRTLAPLPGEHTNTVMQGLGYRDLEIEALRRAGSVA